MKTPTLTITAAIVIPFALACVTLSPQALAVCQEGCDLGKINTFLGDDALINNTTGDANVAIGTSALFTNTTGFLNTAIGAGALAQNTTGSLNTATGSSALGSNTTGDHNTATGSGALYSNTAGNFNTAIGEAALTFNTTGNSNTATGAFALDQNTTGFQNTATGRAALANNTDGNENTGTGFHALLNNTTGSENTATGFHALLNNTTGNRNIALGFRAGSDLTTGDKNIDIGNAGLADESGTIRIGRVEDQTATFIAGIAGATVPTGVAVVVDRTGHLGTTTSSARFKEAIKPMDKASEAILALKPVTFRYKKELDADAIPQFGLVAEDVAKVDSDLVAKDNEGKPYTVRYEAVNAMLLNEFLKEHKKVEELEKQLQRMAARLDAKGL
jgi:Chaperone of endosialidase